MKRQNVLLATIAVLSIFIIAAALSLAASSFPDGLEKVAENLRFADRAANSLDEGFFLIPDYVFRGLENKKLQTSLAGFFGVLIILAVFSLIYLIYRVLSIKNAGRKNEHGK